MSESVLVCRVEAEGNILGWLVVDSALGGRATGGLRMLPDVSEEELRILARAMTLKFGLLGLPQGGAKAGVRFDPEAPEQERFDCLLRFARALGPLLRSRLYLPFADMGTDNRILRRVLRATGAPVRHRELRGDRSGYWTACGVFAAVREACRQAGMELAGRTVAIEGFGKVGSALARLLAGASAKIVAVSTSRGMLYREGGLDVEALIERARQAGSGFVEAFPDAERLPRERLPEVEADILAPCARHHTIHAGNVSRVRARVVVPGANAPCAPEAERELETRGILCVPDFLANSGGALGGTMEFAGMTDDVIRHMLDGTIERLTRWAFEQARLERTSPRAVAERAALARHAELRRQADAPAPMSRLFSAALELYRRGLIPPAIAGRLAPLYFSRLARRGPAGSM